jgi:hypothetical protein
MDVLLSTAYWPNLHYTYYVLNSTKTFIERHEHYQKQSFRNRTQILSANGVLDLTVPVKKIKDKELISSIEISYAENWQNKHWRAITSAYKNSPYFDFFEDELKKFYENRYELLIDYNTEQLKSVFKILKLPRQLLFTDKYEKEPAQLKDLREMIHPKKIATTDKTAGPLLSRPYYQTFEDKFGFTPNLSILDLLLNKGLEALDYFPKETLTL